jgi:tetratricopeptide (TPR) repeat protein
MKSGENNCSLLVNQYSNPVIRGFLFTLPAKVNPVVKSKLIITSLLIIVIATTTAQTKKPTPPLAKNNSHLKVFDLAIASGDISTASTALNYYISEQGSDNAYADTLAMLYMQQGAFGQSYFWANKRLEKNPGNNTLLELKGIALDKLQQPKQAIDIFEKLFAKTQSPYHAYKLMELQYGIKRLNECLQTAEQAEKLTYKPEYVMTYTAGQQTGRTYLQAGIYNIHALALYDLDKKAEAKTFFEKALALDSSFVLAKQNLETLLSIEKGDSKKAAPSNIQQQPSPANKQN